jgi:hypothetical protein
MSKRHIKNHEILKYPSSSLFWIVRLPFEVIKDSYQPAKIKRKVWNYTTQQICAEPESVFKPSQHPDYVLFLALYAYNQMRLTVRNKTHCCCLTCVRATYSRTGKSPGWLGLVFRFFAACQVPEIIFKKHWKCPSWVASKRDNKIFF